MSDAELRVAVAEAATSFARGEYVQLLLALSAALDRLGGELYLSDEEMAERCRADLAFMADPDDDGVLVWVKKYEEESG